jgi:hypothetical protein
MISRAEATRNALAKGASAEEIERQAVNYERQVGTVPFNHMIRALNLHPWLNDAADWTRLAAALIARGRRRGKSR